MNLLLKNALRIVRQMNPEMMHRRFSAPTNVTKIMLASNKNNIIWIDLEMTGLNVENDNILEIACIVTDAELNTIAEGPDIIVHQDDNLLNNMNEWCIEQHNKTGLTDACRKSTTDLKAAEKIVLDFVKKHAPEGKCPLAGNSVYMDRLFLKKYMSTLDSYMHYRIIDVSTIKELSKRWYPKAYHQTPSKVLEHRALSDIRESIVELKYYKDNVFKN